MKRRFIGLSSLIAVQAWGQESTATLEQLIELLGQQEQRIAALERQQGDTISQLDATVDFVESLDIEAQSGATTLGGYGELHYNRLDAVDPSHDVDTVDFHRFVLFVGHRFNDRISLFSELEIEHSLSGDGKPGEVEIEQAFVDIRMKQGLTAKVGLFLLPIGILNETHEPPTFYGVERNSVENIIVPSTWWEAGGGFSGYFANGLSWDVAVHSGLAMPTTGASAYRVRSGRQKVAQAMASDWATTARIKYAGVPGLELAASLQYQSDPSQVAGDGLDSGHLLSANLIYRHQDFSLRALYGAWRFDGLAVEAAGADEQDGWYLEPSYKLNSRWGVYVRYEDVDGARSVDQFSQWETGFNFWPHSDVVLKVDYRQREMNLPGEAGRDFDGLDLGFGYQF